MPDALPPALDTFLEELRRQDLAVNTLESYASDLALFARWFTETNDETFAPHAVTPTDVREYRTFLTQIERRSPATVNRRLAALRKYFLWARAAGLVREIPTDTVKGIASTTQAPKALAKKDVDRLIRTVEKAENKRDLAIVLTLRHTGLRVSELCALRLADVELAERKGTVTVRLGKGNRHRVVPLNVDVRRALNDYLQARPKVTSDHFFIGQRGQGLKPQAVENLVRKYARLANLDAVTPHTLRHTFGKQALDAGADLVTVSRLLGHQRLETTAIYTTPSERDLEQAVARLEADYSDPTGSGRR